MKLEVFFLINSWRQCLVMLHVDIRIHQLILVCQRHSKGKSLARSRGPQWRDRVWRDSRIYMVNYLHKLCWLLVPIWIRVETFTFFLLKLKVLCGALHLVIARSNHIILVFLRFVRYKCSVYLLQDTYLKTSFFITFIEVQGEASHSGQTRSKMVQQGNKSRSQLLTSFNYRHLMLASR